MREMPTVDECKINAVAGCYCEQMGIPADIDKRTLAEIEDDVRRLASGQGIDMYQIADGIREGKRRVGIK